MISGVRGDVAVKIFGADISKLNELASRLGTIMSSIDGAEDVYTTLNEGAQYYTVAVNRLEAGRLGLSVDEIARRFAHPDRRPDHRHRAGGRAAYARSSFEEASKPGRRPPCWPVCP